MPFRATNATADRAQVDQQGTKKGTLTLPLARPSKSKSILKDSSNEPTKEESEGKPVPTPKCSAPKPQKTTAPLTPIQAMCINQTWLEHTKRGRMMAMYTAAFAASPKLADAIMRDSKAIVVQYCKHAGGEEDPMAVLLDAQSGREREVVVLAMLFLTRHGTADDCFAVIQQAKDRVNRCESARRQAFSFLANEGARVALCPAATRPTQWDAHLPDQKVLLAAVASDLRSDGPAAAAVAAAGDAEQSALQKVLECCESYLDHHKESAFISCMEQPARLLFHLVRNQCDRDHVNVHGLNGYMGILRGGLGVNFPALFLANDPHTSMGCGDHWRGLSQAAWDEFAKPENFGKAFEGIATFRAAPFGGGEKWAKYVAHAKAGQRGAGGRWVRGNAESMERRAKEGDASYSVYLDRFAYFFSKEFLVRRMFETVNSEANPEHAGFGASCETLFTVYRANAEHKVPPECASLVEHLYDDMLLTLDVDAAHRFFQWLGVLC